MEPAESSADQSVLVVHSGTRVVQKIKTCKSVRVWIYIYIVVRRNAYHVPAHPSRRTICAQDDAVESTVLPCRSMPAAWWSHWSNLSCSARRRSIASQRYPVYQRIVKRCVCVKIDWRVLRARGGGFFRMRLESGLLAPATYTHWVVKCGLMGISACLRKIVHIRLCQVQNVCYGIE